VVVVRVEASMAGHAVAVMDRAEAARALEERMVVARVEVRERMMVVKVVVEKEKVRAEELWVAEEKKVRAEVETAMEAGGMVEAAMAKEEEVRAEEVRAEEVRASVVAAMTVVLLVELMAEAARAVLVAKGLVAMARAREEVARAVEVRVMARAEEDMARETVWWAVAAVHTQPCTPCDDQLCQWASRHACSDTSHGGTQTHHCTTCIRLVRS
jgi:hypothetical protein